jgi:hypothetical protein
MDLFVLIVRATVLVTAEFCYKAMIVTFGIYLAVRWGII